MCLALIGDSVIFCIKLTTCFNRNSGSWDRHVLLSASYFDIVKKVQFITTPMQMRVRGCKTGQSSWDRRLISIRFTVVGHWYLYFKSILRFRIQGCSFSLFWTFPMMANSVDLLCRKRDFGRTY